MTEANPKIVYLIIKIIVNFSVKEGLLGNITDVKKESEHFGGRCRFPSLEHNFFLLFHQDLVEAKH